MHQVMALMASAFIVVSSAYAQQARKPVSTQYITFTAPESFDQLWADAHLVVRARVLGGRADLMRGGPNPRAARVFTVHRIELLEVYKSQVPSECAAAAADVKQCAPHVGDTITLWQHAGEVEDADRIVRIADETPLRPGVDHFLFLIWHAPLNAFVSPYGSYGAFEVRNGTVHMTAKGNQLREHEGKAAAVLAEELRRKGGAK